MGLFDFFGKGPDINEGVAKFKAESRAVLLDVRSANEYAGGHIPRSRNLPVTDIKKAESALPDKDMPIFVYCEAGSRAKKAVAELQKMGYTRVESIGALKEFKGKVERSQAKNKTMASMKNQAAKAQRSEPWNQNLPKM